MGFLRLPHGGLLCREDICSLRVAETESTLGRLIKLEPSDCTAYLESSKEIEDAFIKAAQNGRSEAPSPQDEVDHHYICLVKSSVQVYQLDGDLDGPVHRGPLTGDEDVLARRGLDIIREYTDSEKDGRFGLLALV